MRFTNVILALSLFIPAYGMASTPAAEEFPVGPPPLSEDYFPCMANCHKDMKPDPTPRKLKEHSDIKLHHAEQFRWCLDCHDTNDRDKLHLQSGERLDFEVSYRLCGQFHGDKYRDWKAGIHGKRIGQWNGKKTYYLCANCHNPHNPAYTLNADKANFPEIPAGKPMPPPEVPGSVGGHGPSGGHAEPAKSGH